MPDRHLAGALRVLCGLLALSIIGCSPTQLAPMPLLALAQYVDAAQAEHAPSESIDWPALVAAHDAHLERWEEWRVEGVNLWALRPLDLEGLVGDDGAGALTAAFGPWSGLVRRAQGLDRRLHDDLHLRRAAHADALIAAAARRRAAAGLAARAAEVSEPVARGLLDLRLAMRLATASEIPQELLPVIAAHEREQTQLIESLDEALLEYLRHFTVEGEWRGGVNAEMAEDEQRPIPRVAWDAIVRVIAITDALVRLADDCAARLVERATGTHRRDLLVVISLTAGEPAIPDELARPDDPEFADDFTDALVGALAVLHDEAAEPTLRAQILTTLEVEGTLARRVMLLGAHLVMSMTLDALPRSESETIPAALRHLDREVILREFVTAQQERGRNASAAKASMEASLGKERLATMRQVVEEDGTQIVEERLRAAGPRAALIGAWHELPSPEPWRRASGPGVVVGRSAVDRAVEGALADMLAGGVPGRVAPVRPPAPAVDLEGDLARSLTPLLDRFLPGDELDLAEAAIESALTANTDSLRTASAAAAAWIEAGLARAEWPEPRVLDRAAADLERAALLAVAESTGRDPGDPLLACLSLDWALNRLHPDRACGTSEARRDHATSPTLVIDHLGDASAQRIAAAHIAESAAELVRAAEHAFAALDRVALMAKRETFVEDHSTDALRKRIAAPPVHGSPSDPAADDADHVPARVRAAVRDAEIALTERAALAEMIVDEALRAVSLDRVAPSRAAPGWAARGWSDAAFPLSAAGTDWPNAPRLVTDAAALSLEFADDDPDDAGDRLIALLDLQLEGERRTDHWRRATIERSRALPFLPMGRPDHEALRAREAALWARHRLHESHVRAALLALSHADGPALIAIREALGMRNRP